MTIENAVTTMRPTDQTASVFTSAWHSEEQGAGTESLRAVQGKVA